MAARAKRWKRQLVDFQAKDEDHECALLGALGFSSNYILRQTGLRPGQISYRLHKAEISRMDFRNGVSPWAKLLLGEMREITEPNMTEYLRRYSTPHQKAVTGGYERKRPKATPRRHSFSHKG